MLPTAENNKGAKFATQNLSMTGASDYKNTINIWMPFQTLFTMLLTDDNNSSIFHRDILTNI